MKSLGYKGWTYISFALLAIVAGFLALQDDDIRVISLLAVPPLVAGLTTTPRRTALVTATAIALAIGTGLLQDEELFSTSHLLRIMVVVITAALAVQTAILRERDLRTRRRLNLINAARNQLDATSGIEEDLASFCRAAIAAEFAEWAILDVRVPGGSVVRIVEQSDSAGRLPVRARAEPTSASTAYESEVQREGGKLMQHAPDDLLAGLFEGELLAVQGATAMVKPVSVGDLKAVYYFICPKPHPPWGEAELTQVGSLTRAAGQKARSDQLIDRITHAQDSLRESRDEVEAIVSGIASGIVAQRADGTIVYANDTAAQMLGFVDAEDLIGSRYDEVPLRMELRDENGDPFDADNLPSRRALNGEISPTASVRYVLNESGREYWTFLRATAVHDSKGEPTLAITVIEDNTERRRAGQAQGFLAEASKMLSVSLDFESAIQAVVRAAVPAMADWCTVELLAANGAIETVAVAHADPDNEPAVRAFREDFPFTDEDFGAPRVIRTGDPELYEQIDHERFLSIYNDEARAAAVEKLAARSSLVAPIAARGRTIGAISMALTRPGTRFTDYDLETAEELGRRAGIALDNARLHTERMRMLSSLQQSLIPATLPDLPGIALSARFRPAEVDAEVGGDFYDAFLLPDGGAALIMGDVCGKGPEAAALTALARYTIRAAAMDESDPEAILRQLNAALLEQVTDGRFCTLAFAKISAEGGVRTAEIISAGHPLPILLSDSATRSVGAPGTLLGVVEHPDLPVESVVLTGHEALVLYTDGLSGGQTTDDTGFALELITKLSPNGTKDLAAAIDQRASETQETPNRDDVAILAARFD